MRSKGFRMLLGTAVLLVFASGAFATLVAPGGTVAPEDFTLGYAGTHTLVTSTSGTNANGTVGGTFVLGVYRESGTDTLDFLYQFTLGLNQLLQPSHPVERITGTTWPSVATSDVGYLTSQGGLGIFSLPTAGAPTSATRNAFGDVGFNWGADGFTGTSVILVVKTNQKDYVPGFASAIDGGVAIVSGYAPVPEPANAGLLLAGLFGAGLFVARRYRVVQN